MGFSYNGVAASVTISGAITTDGKSSPPVLATGQTHVTASINNCAFNAGTGQTVYTVTAGKTLTIHGWAITGEGANCGAYWLRNGAGTKYGLTGSSSAVLVLNSFLNCGGIIGVFAAGDTVKIDGTANIAAGNKMSVAIWGIEQ